MSSSAPSNNFSPSLMLAGMDYIAPSAECILPVTLRSQGDTTSGVGGVGYRRTQAGEDAHEEAELPHRGGDVLKITLKDCLACSGCVTTAETILVNSQSRGELLKAREAQRETPAGLLPLLVTISDATAASIASYAGLASVEDGHALIAGFVRAVLAPDTSPQGSVGAPLYVTDLRWATAISASETAREYERRVHDAPDTLPLLVSACPGWVCYCEKQGGALLPHLSPVLSPQGIAGSYVKRTLRRDFYHMSLQPCFDRKLEAARDHFIPTADAAGLEPAVYYTDCVLSTSELLEWMVETDPALPWRGSLDSSALPLTGGTTERSGAACATQTVSTALAVSEEEANGRAGVPATASPAQLFAAMMEGSGGYHRAVMTYMHDKTNSAAPLTLHYEQKRNHNHQLVTDAALPGQVFCVAYGFQQIQNTVRAIKKRLPAARAYTLVELMACPDGCLNGGGQIRAADASAAEATLQSVKTAFARSLESAANDAEKNGMTCLANEEGEASEKTLAPLTRQPRLEVSHTTRGVVAHDSDGPFSPEHIQVGVDVLGESLWRCTFTDRQKEFEKMLDQGNIQSLKW